MTQKKRAVLTHRWIPLATLVAALVTLSIHAVTYHRFQAVLWVQVLAASLVPLALPLIERAAEREAPLSLHLMVAAHIVLACDLGSTLGFYSRIAWWDLFLHGLFGLWAAALLAMLWQWLSGSGAHFVGGVLFPFLGVMGGAALWECGEFISDMLLNADAQRVAYALALGENPIADTMTDILIAIVGAAVFFAGRWIARRMAAKK